jgi:hypothetical protein
VHVGARLKSRGTGDGGGRSGEHRFPRTDAVTTRGSIRNSLSSTMDISKTFFDLLTPRQRRNIRHNLGDS